jgi:hypothetical protein
LEGGDRDTMDRIKALEASIKDSEMAIPEEIALIDKKRSNVVIFGIPVVSREADKKAVFNLLMGIDAMSDFSCYRIGDAKSPNHPIIVRFQSASLRDQVITNAKKLKEQEQYNNISIKPDFTKRQQALNTQKEDALRADAGTRNACMPTGEKMSMLGSSLESLATGILQKRKSKPQRVQIRLVKFSIN